MKYTLLCFALLMGLVAGCGDDTNYSSSSDKDDTENNGAASCMDNVDCKGGEACRDGVCREICDEGDPCTVDGQTCAPDLGFCVECIDDNGCNSGICIQNQCQDAECSEDADCSGGFQCLEGRCESIDGPDMMDDPDMPGDTGVPGDLPSECERTRCESGELVTCNAQGEEVRGACPPNSICEETSETNAQCSELICEPGARTCLNDNTVGACNATGTRFNETSCDDTEACEEGSCVERTCTPGELLCQGNNVVRCVEGGEHQPVQACGEGEQCIGGFCGSEPPGIRVYLTWENGETVGQDLDIHLLNLSPGAQWDNAPWDCYWRNIDPNWGDVNNSEDDPSLDIDAVQGPGPEIISLEEPASGNYKIGVYHFTDNGLGSANATVTVQFEGEVVFEGTQNLTEAQFWEVAHIQWNDDPIVTPINTTHSSFPRANICNNDDQCPDGLCVEGSCTDCTGDEHCSDGLVCAEGTCVACTNDSHCGSDYCSSDNTCVECISDAHCEGDQVCFSGECTEVFCDPDAQEPNNSSDQATNLNEISPEDEFTVCEQDQDWFFAITDNPLPTGSVTISYTPADAPLRITGISVLQPDGFTVEGENGSLTAQYLDFFDLLGGTNVSFWVHTDSPNTITYNVTVNP